ARFYFRLRPVRRFDVDLHLIVSELELCYFRFFANLRAVFARMIEQKFVELRARHLISAIALRTKAVLEVKLYSFRSARRGDFPAVLGHERRVQFLADAKAIESVHAEGQERFANVETRELFALEHNYTPPGLGQQR